MRAPLVVVTGTGTEIGKTHVSRALLAAWGTFTRVAGVKPVETGVAEGEGEDARALRAASTFHVKPTLLPPYRFARPVSPHLAAREEGVEIALSAITAYVDGVRRQAEGVLVELAGGLFSPLGEGITNADAARALDADFALLVASDRLGVLHDVTAATRAAGAEGLAISAVALVAPAQPDGSTGNNADELHVVVDHEVALRVPRATVAALATRPDFRALASRLAALRPRD